MALSYSDVLAEVLLYLQDTGAAIFASAETQYGIENELKTISRYSPHIVDIMFKIESRTGTDTAGATNKLTDTTKSQFLTTDDSDEKVIHNITDNTWATATTAIASTATVITLNADIMGSGDSYRIYNKRCKNSKQIYIGDVTDLTDYMWIDSVEYPLGTKRNWEVYGGVLEIDVNRVADSNSTLDPPNNIDVLVRFAMPHRLCQLTDLFGACTAIEPAGETTLAVKGLLGAEVIEIGDELYIANHRSLYTVTTGKLLAGSGAGNGTGDIIVFPGMEAATVTNDIITFVKSSLRPQEENFLVRLVSARAAISKSTLYYAQVNSAVSELSDASTAIGAVAALIALATTASTGDIALARVAIAKPPTATTGSIALANAQFDKLNAGVSAPIDLAVSGLASGLALVNTIPIGGGAAEFMGQAASNVGVAQGYLVSGQAFLQQSSVEHANGAASLNAATTDIRSAGEKVNEAIANLRLVASRLQVARGGQTFESWGRTELAQVERELRTLGGFPISRRYPSD